MKILILDGNPDSNNTSKSSPGVWEVVIRAPSLGGGAEGIKIQPNWMTRKLFKHFYELGTKFTDENGFDREVMRKLAPREQLSKGRLFFFRLLDKTGKGNFYWDMQLKQNKAFEKRFDKP